MNTSISKNHNAFPISAHKLLVQGKPNGVYTIIFTYISELLGEKEIIPLARQAYRMKVDTTTVEANFNNLCTNIPSQYYHSYPASHHQPKRLFRDRGVRSVCLPRSSRDGGSYKVSLRQIQHCSWSVI
jgi:hypothetical protein